MEDKITIIEGPPPVFEPIQEGWVMGLNESSGLYDLSVTRLRTFNGPALVERCYHTWHAGGLMYLEYRDLLGLEKRSPILAVRAQNTHDGQVLFLWVRRELEESEIKEDSPGEDQQPL
ncbi:MAG: hypothetical protein JXR32_09420 [Anaerolineaceae bacterium]|nr:hypothetical protein [Anaerolineaceae bacterium]